jgi:hypothetical protein
MRIIWLLFIGVMALSLQAQDTAPEIPTTSTIEGVTVFLKGAQISRTAEVDIPKGRSKVVLKGLSAFMDPSTIKVKNEGDFLVLSISHNLNFLDLKEMEQKIQDLQDQLLMVKDSISYQKAVLASLNEEDAFLKNNRTIGGQQNGYNPADLKEMDAYFRQRLREIKMETLGVSKELNELQEQQGYLQKELRQFLKDNDRSTSEVTVICSAEKATKGTLEFSYMASNAGWFPSYDLRAVDVESPIVLNYKANLHQNTGEDWKQVRMTFSNANPYQNGVPPTLKPYYLSGSGRKAPAYAQIQNVYQNAPALDGANVGGLVSGRVTDANGEPLIGANILISGTTIGTITDFDGNFSLGVPPDATALEISYVGFQTQSQAIRGQQMNIVLQESSLELEEVAVMGARVQSQSISSYIKGVKQKQISEYNRTLPAQPVVNQTTVEIELDIPYTVLSDGENYTLELASYEMPASYQYRAIPKKDPTAFLIAQIVDWDQYNILAGEVNLFFEDTYVGRSLLDVRYLSDTLNVSLGPDKSVQVDRQRIKEFQKRQFFGSKKVQEQAYRIWVRNNKAQTIQLVIEDQIPISNNKEVEVESLDLTGGKLNAETGIITWELSIAPNKEKELKNHYRVKSPKDSYFRLE